MSSGVGGIKTRSSVRACQMALRSPPSLPPKKFPISTMMGEDAGVNS